MNYDAQEVVWVRIASPDRKPYQIQEAHHKAVTRFRKWLWERNIHPAFVSSSGGGQWHGAFYPSDWGYVKAWLEEQDDFSAGPYQ